MSCTCNPGRRRSVVRSDTIAVSQCNDCGARWLTTTDGTHEADGDTLALCEIINSLINQKRGTYDPITCQPERRRR